MTETTIDETPIAESSPAEDSTPAKMHKFSEYVHVGPGAAECEHGQDGQCQDPLHFHAWCRLPNQFERKSISEKATAGEARALRALRNVESDKRVILDGELAGVIARNDREALIEEIVGEEFLQDHLRAVAEIAQEDEEDQWETIDEDRERLRALDEKAEDDRDAGEYQELGDRIAEHTRLVNERRDAIQIPKRQAVADKSVEDLADIVREARIEQAGEARRREDYLKWELHVCTLKPKDPSKPGFPNERAFGSIDDFTSGPPEALEAITSTITALEQEAADHLKGSS